MKWGTLILWSSMSLKPEVLYEMKFFLTLILGFVEFFLIAGIFLPVIPFPVKAGWHGIGGEFCGLAYDPKCDTSSWRFLTYAEIKNVIDTKQY